MVGLVNVIFSESGETFKYIVPNISVGEHNSPNLENMKGKCIVCKSFVVPYRVRRILLTMPSAAICQGVRRCTHIVSQCSEGTETEVSLGKPFNTLFQISLMPNIIPHIWKI